MINSKVKVKWGMVPGADAYEVYAAYCSNSSFKKVMTVQAGNQAVIKKPGGKKLLASYHGVPLRFVSSDEKVATVTAKGRVKAVGAGTCGLLFKIIHRNPLCFRGGFLLCSEARRRKR